MGRPTKPKGKIKNVLILDHYAGCINFVVETPWDGDVSCEISGSRKWNKKLQQIEDLTYDENYGLVYCIDHGQPIEEEIPCSKEGIEMLKKAAKKLAELCMRTNHSVVMRLYLQNHPNFLIIK